MVGDEIVLYASHHQFYVQDNDRFGEAGGPTFWTLAASDNKMAVGNGTLAFGTGSYDFVKVRVELHDSEPSVDLTEWDHVREAGLDLLTSFLVIYGCLSISGLFFRLRPGHYRVRCCDADLADSENEGSDKVGDCYLVQVWPATYSSPRVLKRWRGKDADRYIAELDAGLRAILQGELASGNEVLQVFNDVGKIKVLFRDPFRGSFDELPPGVNIRETTNPRYSHKVKYVHEGSGNSLECRPNEPAD